MKSSRLRLSLASVVRSKLIFESDENVPSSFRMKVPAAPVATSTASDGRFTPTSCSRTRTVAFDVLLTVQVPVVVVVTAVALGVLVAVDVGRAVALGAAAPPHAAKRKLTVASGATIRERHREIIGSSALCSSDLTGPTTSPR